MRVERDPAAEALLERSLQTMVRAHSGVFLVRDARDARNWTPAGGDVDVVQPVQGEQLHTVVSNITQRRDKIFCQFPLIVKRPLHAVSGALEGIEHIPRSSSRELAEVDRAYIHR